MFSIGFLVFPEFQNKLKKSHSDQNRQHRSKTTQMVAGVHVLSNANKHGCSPHQQGLLSISSSVMRSAGGPNESAQNIYQQQYQQGSVQQQRGPGGMFMHPEQQRLFQQQQHQRQMHAAAEHARSRAMAAEGQQQRAFQQVISHKF